MSRLYPIPTVFCLLMAMSVMGQQNTRKATEKCGTMLNLELRFQQNAALRNRFEQKKIEFNRVMSTRATEKTLGSDAITYIPVVFHIVMNNPGFISDAQVQAQLDTLNHDFFGANSDSIKIPSYFKSLFGKSNIQFCLARRTPDGEATNGIVRKITSKNTFALDDGVKHSFSGGSDSWDTDRYLNVWICTLATDMLGYASFPDDEFPDDQGVVIDFRVLPGGSFSRFNEGKTLTHEIGHYFNLYHIWGDDGGLCNGSDFIDDTPNQADATYGNFKGVKTDDCTSTGNGIMYQNYMDYTDDVNLVMFTPDQATRMQSALSFYRSSLLSSNGCQPVVLNNFDAQLKSLNQPTQRLCNPAFTPQVTIRNRGSQVLTSLQISTSIDNGPVNSFQWTGSVPTYSSVTVSLNNLTTTPGVHTLMVFLSNPNNNSDQEPINDTLRMKFQYITAISQLTEGFESTMFPPAGWDVLNPDNALTWERVSSISRSGNASARMNNFDYDGVGQPDDLRLPPVTLPNLIDSAFLSFHVASASFTDLNTPGNPWDTLEVLISQDCGNSYTSVYKKWGKELATEYTATTLPFFPMSSQWRKDSINLSSYIGADNLLIAFRNTTGFENNLYLDDVHLRTVLVNPNLKAQGLLVTPNPVRGNMVVQFYPEPSDLQSIQVYNSAGQKVNEIVIGVNGAGTYYSFNMSSYPKGMYMVRIVFRDRVTTKKLIKL